MCFHWAIRYNFDRFYVSEILTYLVVETRLKQSGSNSLHELRRVGQLLKYEHRLFLPKPHVPAYPTAETKGTKSNLKATPIPESSRVRPNYCSNGGFSTSSTYFTTHRQSCCPGRQTCFHVQINRFHVIALIFFDLRHGNNNKFVSSKTK